MSQQDREAWRQHLAKRSLHGGPKRSKYGAVKTTIDGLTFDSKREAARYTELKLREKAGEIESLEVHPRYSLCVVSQDAQEEDPPQIIGAYEADFAYFDCQYNGFIVEDVKGVRTAIYAWKKKHFEAQYGIEIREIR